ncbi:flagellar motor switch protein FliN/FliY [Paracoccus isoporae]|uniref:Flagellar motor switch protein FliN/FliY n=1 Tax=Paracoccus isoporae TaxID=591205 RepID=A0A1G6Z816_9RHOB|nr:FliM/FliN family flagellar motor C-terminal domain-containing protein [Paracoccus isoporae]SDD98423.1 flagellar motor switch protein FliN/FliY [Paracoccus isoporae]
MDQASIIATEQIPVEVTIRIGRRRMTVAEIAALRESDVIPLEQTLAEQVELCVGDHVIATAELVAGEDEEAPLMLRISDAKGAEAG